MSDKREDNINSYLSSHDPVLKIKRDSLKSSLELIKSQIEELKVEREVLQSREAKQLISKKVKSLSMKASEIEYTLERLDKKIDTMIAQAEVSKLDDTSLLTDELDSASSLSSEILGELNEQHQTDHRENPSEQGNVRELESKLAAVNKQIAAERKIYHDGLAIINRITLNKTKPVIEGSSAYHECLRASKAMQKAEAKAPALKRRKSSLTKEINALKGN